MRSLKIVAMLVALNTIAWFIPQEASAQHGSASYRLFYDALSPYGYWVDYPNYGYVWMPDVDPDFSPYATAGHWVFTDDGWMWVSDYPWGWATFHYGRWDYDELYGWFWVPDDEWGPAWVSWRRSPGYYGWAPLRPGISINISFGSDYRERNERWIFVRDRDIARPDIDRYYVNRTNNATIINNSTLIVNTQRDDKRNATYITGPGRDDVQRATNTTVRSIPIRDNSQPGDRVSNGEVQIYRPQVQKGSVNGQVPTPSKVMRLNEIRPASERNAANRQQQLPKANPAGNAQPPQQRVANPSGSRGRQQQLPTVDPARKVQPPQQRAVNPSESKGRQPQPQNIAPPAKAQVPQQRGVNPSSKGRQQQRAATPPIKAQPAQPRVVAPSDNKGKQQQPGTVSPSNRGQSPQPLKVDPARGKGKQTQNVPPPKKVGETQPKNKQDEKQKQREQ